MGVDANPHKYNFCGQSKRQGADPEPPQEKGPTMNVTRRSFIGTASTAAAIATIAAVPALAEETSQAQTNVGETLLPNEEGLVFHPSVPCDPSFEAEPIADEDITETITCDVVVCGAGMAGACAAASCAQNGLKTIVLEKGEIFAARGSEIGAINDRAHNEAGVSIDPAELLADAMASSHYRADRKVWKTYIDRSGEAMDWAQDTSAATEGSECGAFKVVGQNTIYDGVTTWCSGVRVEGGTYSFVAMMLDNAIQNGAEVRYSSPACQLMQDADGKVHGVIAKTEGGYVKFETAKGVVLATGGYDNNWDYLCKSVRPRDLAVNAWINPTKTEAGDGHLMAKAVGAAEDDLPHVLMNDPAGSTSGQRANGCIFAFPRVNEYGERFINESLSFEYLTNMIMYQPGAHDYVLLSGDLLAAFDIMRGVIPWTPEDLYDNCKDLLIQADTIEELAEKIGVNADNLKATVDRYNELCAKGVDEDFGKNPTTLLPMDEPPFYAIEESGSCLTTVSGLKVNEHSQVLSTTGSPIDGLYALGNTSGSMFFGTYPHHISAVSHGRCLCFGYLVGRKLAGLEDA